jgi:Transcription factor WhiB
VLTVRKPGRSPHGVNADVRSATVEVLPRPAWHRDGICSGSDPAIWHPHRGKDRMIGTLRTICRSCPTRCQCASQGIHQSPPLGVWAGLTTKTLIRLRNHGEATVDGDVFRWDGTEVTVIDGKKPKLSVIAAKELLISLVVTPSAVA